MARRLPIGLILVLVGFAAGLAGEATAQQPPPAETVFRLEVGRGNGGDLVLGWTILPGNYLYREKIKAMTEAGAPLAVETDPGEEKDDPNFGPTEVYHGSARGRIAADLLPKSGTISVSFQGCAERGICYPPIRKSVDLATLAVNDTVRNVAAASPALKTDVVAAAPATRDEAQESFSLSGNPALMLATFFGFGLLLSFTPCVFPMIPILAGVITRSCEQPSTRRGLLLSSVYVLAMAAAYGLLGVVAAWSGENLQTALQTPWALAGMGLAFVALAFSMFGLYDLAPPVAFVNSLSRLVAGKGGSFAGAAILGFGSALIVGPCATPPLAAALLYISQTGNIARGAGALFALGLGMGAPLVAVGTFGAGILPRSGPWLATAKAAFGVVFLGIAIEMVGRILPGPVTLALWALLALALGVVLGFGVPRTRFAANLFVRGLGAASIVYGAVLAVKAAGGANDPLRPFAFPPFDGPAAEASATSATTVTSTAAMDAVLTAAQRDRRPILVSFTAAWCTVCKDIERTVMADPAIVARLKNISVVHADVTTITPEAQALMRRFDVVGPPTSFLVDARTGREIDGTRIIGPMTPADFAARLGLAGA